MNIIWSIIIGFVTALIARLMVPVKKAGGLVEVAAIGIVGSLGAYYAGFASGWYTPTDAVGLLSAGIGAVLLLTVHFIASSKPD